MKRKTIYLAGKVSGLPFEQVALKFDKKQIELELNGHKVINPVGEVWEYNHVGVEVKESTWEEEMRVCIKRLMDADELHLLPCWQSSRGATLERDIALRLGIPIVYH